MQISEVIKLIPDAQRKRGIWIVLSVVFKALLNMAGLTVLIPLIILIFDPEKMQEYPLLASHHILIVVAIIVFLVVKNLFNIYLSDIRIRFINSLYIYYSKKIYNTYYQQGLLFLKGKHSNELAYNVSAVSYLFTHGLLSLSFSIASEALLLLLIWGAMFWYSPVMALSIAGCLLPFVAGYYYWVRQKLKDYGKKENEAKRRSMALVNDTFQGYTEVKLNNAYSWFQRRFGESIAQVVDSRERMTHIQQIPSGMMECYVMIGMVLFILIGGNDSETRLTLGILAIATLRMLPSIRSLITMMTQWKNNSFTIDVIKEIPPVVEVETESLPISFKEQITIDDISFHYPDDTSFVFEHFSLKIRKGECVGIQGFSGIGKTTLFNLLLGFYTPQKGEIRIDNTLLDKQTYAAWQKMIAYVPQDIFIMRATLAENIALGSEDIDNERLMQVIAQSGLASLVDTLPEGIDTKIGQNGSRLSGGERQRVGIARALYKKAEVLFFDEATSALDTQTEQSIVATINDLSAKENGLTIIIIAHRESSLIHCDRIIRI
ncbi:ABC transporter ATP-binding protein [Dysgonomonas sp. 511]|uniref:ABC transporter ATP-binding protein n=1 Tax=Dysgonomonas sp. 511 TaxID=2302930 RepID=UPI0013D80747|nr:ABC transporter ATP-binding protein [Dysgonomonas sp. 511]NDV78072.1 ABC transporter ATP-binding protein [Dysgonomonas sp. 511]